MRYTNRHFTYLLTKIDYRQCCRNVVSSQNVEYKMDRQANEEVLHYNVLIAPARELVTTIATTQIRFFGYTLRKEKLE